MNAREVALNILNEVYTQQAYANISLSRQFAKKSIIRPRPPFHQLN